MQKKILSYLAKNPEESKKIDESIFSNEYQGLFRIIKNRALKQKAVTIDFVIKDGCKIGYFNTQAIFAENVSKSEFQEYLEITTKINRLSFFDQLFHKYFEKFSKATVNDKLGVLIDLKEELIKTNTAIKKYVVHGKEMFENWIDKYGQPIKYKAKFGIPLLDETLGGLRGTELVVVVADTGVGKSNLLLNFAYNMLKQGKKILFFSLEMGVDELLDRFIPIAGEHNAKEIRERAERKEVLETTTTELKKFDFKIISDGNITSDDVVSEMINQQPDIVFVDYLQRLSDPRGNGSEMERLRAMTQKLKNGALKLRIPVITPAQVDKASSLRGTHRIENVAGAKDIANEADIGLYLYEERMTTTDAHKKSIRNAVVGAKISGMIEKKYSGIIKKEDNSLLKLKLVKSRHSQKDIAIDIAFNKNNLKMEQLN